MDLASTVDVVEVVTQRWRDLKPRGLLFGQIRAQADLSPIKHCGGLRPDLCQDGIPGVRGAMAL
jgi:hypothetical protein